MLSPDDERTLLDRARGSDQAQSRAALSSLLRAQQDEVRKQLRLLVGQPDDVDDLLQETMLAAYTDLGSKPADMPFGTWFQQLAVNQATAFLALQRRWRAAAQILVEDLCTSHGHLDDVLDIMRDVDFQFDVGEHVAFCFSAVGRSLPLEQQTAVMLTDVLGLSPEAAADALRARPEDIERFRGLGLTALGETYDRLCALGAKPVGAACNQCRGLRAVAPEGRSGSAPERLGLDNADPAERLRRRLKVVSDANLDRGPGRKLHDFLYRLMADNEANRDAPEDQDDNIPRGSAHWEGLLELHN